MESKVLIGFRFGSPEFKEAMRRANEAADPEKNPPNWKRNKVPQYKKGKHANK